MARYESVNQIINDAAVECGLDTTTDPVSSTNESFVQLRNMLNTAGRQMVVLNNWEVLDGNYAFTTQEGDTGTYDLPSDFARMVDQTGWDRSNNVPMGGPLSSQDWAYLEGRDLISQSIYASFQLSDNKLQLYPQPPPVGLDVHFQYISRNWLAQQSDPSQRHDRIQQGSDLCLFDPVMMTLYLTARFKGAKGFDNREAKAEFGLIFESLVGQDTGAAILSAGNQGRSFPYLNAWANTGDTGFGGVP